jgi:hypothetical protein
VLTELTGLIAHDTKDTDNAIASAHWSKRHRRDAFIAQLGKHCSWIFGYVVTDDDVSGANSLTGQPGAWRHAHALGHKIVLLPALMGTENQILGLFVNKHNRTGLNLQRVQAQPQSGVELAVYIEVLAQHVAEGVQHGQLVDVLLFLLMKGGRLTEIVQGEHEQIDLWQG